MNAGRNQPGAIPCGMKPGPNGAERRSLAPAAVAVRGRSVAIRGRPDPPVPCRPLPGAEPRRAVLSMSVTVLGSTATAAERNVQGAFRRRSGRGGASNDALASPRVQLDAHKVPYLFESIASCLCQSIPADRRMLWRCRRRAGARIGRNPASDLGDHRRHGSSARRGRAPPLPPREGRYGTKPSKMIWSA